jgi:8-oxo-dGTP diphosphatase
VSVRATGEFPQRPVVGVGGVVVADGKALLVKRAHDPRKGEWSLPGGRVELGETLVDATRREIREETGLDVDIGPIVEIFDRIHRDNGRVRYHFVIVDFLCTCTGGTLCAGDDADDVAWVSESELDTYGVNPHAAAVVRKALAMSAKRPLLDIEPRI